MMGGLGSRGTPMKFKNLFVLIVSGVVLHSGAAAETKTTTSDALRDRYVEGVRLISEVRASVARANDVLAIVEAGSYAQAGRISDMETRLSYVQQTTGYLETASIRRGSTGQKLLGEKERLAERFGALESALADDRALLSGATKAVDALLTAADKSGKLAERRLADLTADELKFSAEQVHLASNRLAQMELRVKLEFTLLQGLQARAASDAADLKAVNTDQTKLSLQVAAQRVAINKVAADLARSRDRLARQSNEFSRKVEQFRVVQVAVLRRWLIDGPPAGDTPSFTIMDVQEAGFARKPKRPDPSSTVLGASGGGALEPNAAALADDGNMIRGLGAGEADVSQASPEVIQLNNRARWYLAMLSRLSSFVGESLAEAGTWCDQAESWRDGLVGTGRTLADQRGVLATLQMEQDIVTTTVGLIATQESTAQEQVQTVSNDIDLQTKRLETISEELKKRSGR